MDSLEEKIKNEKNRYTFSNNIKSKSVYITYIIGSYEFKTPFISKTQVYF